jgi:hypothetical protein
VPADPPRLNDYDSFAEAYTAENENNLINAHYERPAMLALAGDVAGRRILDVGCGSRSTRGRRSRNGMGGSGCPPCNYDL